MTRLRTLCISSPSSTCVESMRHLITLSRREDRYVSFRRRFTGIGQQDSRIALQYDESRFTTMLGLPSEQIECGRQLSLFAMRYFDDIP